MIFTAFNPILIRKSKDPYGWLGNMSPHPVHIKNERWSTAEALFQSRRFASSSVEIRQQIQEARSPFTAKHIARQHLAAMQTKPHSQEDLDNMLQVLLLKLQTYPSLQGALFNTGQRHIIEDCSTRAHASSLFWGAACMHGTTWKGHNHLGALWMVIRNDLAVLFPRYSQLPLFKE